MMTPQRLAEIEARAKAAQDQIELGKPNHFVAHCRPIIRQDIPDLLAYVRELESEVKSLTEPTGRSTGTVGRGLFG